MPILFCGLDEAGRGPLAGPVVAAAVILDPNKTIPGLADSKKLSPKKRNFLFDLIYENAISVGVGSATAKEIDQINILQASLLAMQRAFAKLSLTPELALIDGNQAPRLPCRTHTIIRGDATEPCISAASIIAKVTRDRYMLTLHNRYPDYGFSQHQGYPTALHLEKLHLLGLTPEHRLSYRPVYKYQELSSKKANQEDRSASFVIV